VWAFGGSLAKVPASELGAHVIKGLLAKTGIDPNLISEAILARC
jgi:acetyl-CoA C-acetyltransferase